MRTLLFLLILFVSFSFADRKLSVAVIPFIEMGSVQERTGFTLAHKIRGMIPQKHYRVMGNQALRATFKRAKVKNPLYIAEDGLSSQEAIQLQIRGVDALIVGIISKHYNTFSLSFQVIYLEKTISTQSFEMDAKNWEGVLKGFRKSLKETRLLKDYFNSNKNPFHQGMALFENEEYAAAIPLLKEAGILGYPSALYNVGWYYENIKKDELSALRWYAVAGKRGHRKARSVASRLKTILAIRVKNQKKLSTTDNDKIEKTLENIIWKDVFGDIKWKDVLEDINWKETKEKAMEGVKWKDVFDDINWKGKKAQDKDIIWKEELKEDSILWRGKKKKAIEGIEWKGEKREEKKSKL